MASLGGAFGGLLGNAVLQQVFLYQVVGQLVGPALSPFTMLVQQEALKQFPVMPLSPADLAEAVLRGAIPADEAKGEALLSGVDGHRFDVMALLAGNAPGPAELAVALRRGIIDHPTYLRGIVQGRLRNEWADTVQKLSVMQPSPQAMLSAELEGQLDHAEALRRYTALGGDPDYYDIQFNTQGQAPTPNEALTLANRGIIPWTGHGPDKTTYEQAFLEGPWRNKWQAPFRALGEYLPPPRTVTAMYKEGAIDSTLAGELLAKQGLSADLVKAYLTGASGQKLGGTKELSLGIVETLYRERLYDAAQATAAFVKLGYSADEAKAIISVQDAALATRFATAALNKAHSRYVGWHITKAVATADLTALHVPAANISQLLTLWDLERETNAPQLTASQIGKSYVTKLLTDTEAIDMLKQLGYSDWLAWLFLSQYTGGPAPNKPAGH